MILAKIEYSPKEKARLEGIFGKYVGKIIKAKGDTAIIEAVGDQAQIKALLEQLDKFGVKELVRTGRLAITE
jgi:acetolactate synthase-1/3 small subunit